MTVFTIEDYEDYFKGPEAMDAFMSLLSGTGDEGGPRLITHKKKLVATTLSPDDTRDYLRSRIAMRFLEQPEALGTLSRRLKNLDESQFVD